MGIKFTKGPWKVETMPAQTAESGEGITAYIIAPVEKDMDNPDHCIAVCSYYKDEEANAHLLAAAPELYTALEQLVFEWCDECGGCSEHDDSCERMRLAFTALAKARGESD